MGPASGKMASAKPEMTIAIPQASPKSTAAGIRPVYVLSLGRASEPTNTLPMNQMPCAVLREYR